MARDVRQCCEIAASIHLLASYALLCVQYSLHEFAYVSRGWFVNMKNFRSAGYV